MQKLVNFRKLSRDYEVFIFYTTSSGITENGIKSDKILPYLSVFQANCGLNSIVFKADVMMEI